MEDDLGGSALCAEVLEHAGYRVFTASDGLRGLALAMERRPNILVADLYLPGIMGDELIRRVRAANLCAATILVSGSFEGRRRAFHCRADAFLEKPFDASSVLDVVARLRARSCT